MSPQYSNIECEEAANNWRVPTARGAAMRSPAAPCFRLRSNRPPGRSSTRTSFIAITPVALSTPLTERVNAGSKPRRAGRATTAGDLSRKANGIALRPPGVFCEQCASQDHERCYRRGLIPPDNCVCDGTSATPLRSSGLIHTRKGVVILDGPTARSYRFRSKPSIGS